LEDKADSETIEKLVEILDQKSDKAELGMVIDLIKNKAEKSEKDFLSGNIVEIKDLLRDKQESIDLIN